MPALSWLLIISPDESGYVLQSVPEVPQFSMGQVVWITFDNRTETELIAGVIAVGMVLPGQKGEPPSATITPEFIWIEGGIVSPGIDPIPSGASKTLRFQVKVMIDLKPESFFAYEFFVLGRSAYHQTEEFSRSKRPNLILTLRPGKANESKDPIVHIPQ
jgi:hypothetical protein